MNEGRMTLGTTLRCYGAVGAVLACGTALVQSAEPPATNAPANQMLLNDNFGKLVAVPTNALPPKLLPPSGLSITNQVPSPAPGTPVPGPVQEREQDQRTGRDTLLFFPPFSPQLAPYLESVDQFGNTASKPGALFPSTPFADMAQRAKYWASKVGLRPPRVRRLALLRTTLQVHGRICSRRPRVDFSRPSEA